LTSNHFFIKQTSLHFPYVLLNGEEHHHLSKVVRLKPNERVWLFDEGGTRYLARVENISQEKTKLFILERIEKEEPKVKITLAQALIRQKKMDFIVQKSTELGVVAFVPIQTARSFVKIGEKIERKMDRWQKIAREASKQCKSSLVPLIMPPQSIKTLIKERAEAKKFLLSENRGKYLKDILIPESNPIASVLLLVGPEGGWAKEEEEFILDHGYQAISLGKQILRTETASLCALALISHFWNL
jgi:16S rRNA (uracil1498-N3)-methyltransferase